MAGRMRTVKPELWVTRRFANLSIPARLTFVGLLNFADDEGYHVDDARLVKAEVYPFDDLTAAEIHGHLAEMEHARIIHRYEAHGEPCLHVLDFRDPETKERRTPWGQRPQKPQPSRFPPCGDDHANFQGTLFDPSPTSNGRVSDASRIGIAKSTPQGPGTRDQGPGVGSRSLADGEDAKPPTEGQRVNALARSYCDVVKLAPFHGVRAVVLKAVKAGDWDDQQISRALARLAEAGRSVSENSLRIELTAPRQVVDDGVVLPWDGRPM